MAKTLVLVYVHGFKGGATTFAKFPDDVNKALQKVFPHDTVQSIIYPPYETRGSLDKAVLAFLDFLESKAIDIEVSKSTLSPVVSPGVGFVLVAHSMGGLVISDTTLQILARDEKYVFPNVLGLLCFDTPFMGLHTSVFAQDVVNRGAAKFNELKSIGASIPVGAVAGYLFSKKSNEQPTQSSKGLKPVKGEAQKKDQPNWGKIAGLTAAGVVTAAAAAAGTAWYLKGKNVDADWVDDHLEFVNAIFQKQNILRERLWKLYESRNRVKMIDYYTVFQPREGGDQKESLKSSSGNSVDPAQFAKTLGKLVSGEGNGKRTFCNVPSDSPYADFYFPAENPKATGEIIAHVTMFKPEDNPKYNALLSESIEHISSWASPWMSE
ncbi:uncharacterized protein V1516DRAFT_672186 [Lipomyces oligophaga]|uniref:uncharacterized protein n=1 Tax=Lipomyces oligophaga TaxID=45792 RepID=UPI0034CD2E3C